MKNTETPNQKLDKVLAQMASFPDGHTAVSYADILSAAGDDLQTLELILGKLIKDGYAVDIKANPAPYEEFYAVRTYQITFDGKVFIENGGYHQQAIHRAFENTRLGTVERAQRVYQNNTLWLTLILAAASLIAALWYVMDLWLRMKN